MLMYIPPDKHHFLSESDLESSENNLILMTSDLLLADSCRHHGLCFLSAWNLKENIDRLPWEKLRGKTVHYFLLHEDCNLRDELDLAIAVCAKIRDAGYGHPRIIDCNGNKIQAATAKVYRDTQFGELVAKYGMSIDLRGFPDYTVKVEMTGCEETAVPYISTKHLFVVLGEQKAGKSWILLWHLLRLAFTGTKPAKVLYFYGEDEGSRIDENISILKKSMKIPNNSSGIIKPINLAMASCVTPDGFDLKDRQCGEYLLGHIDKELAAFGEPPLVAVALDNYATLMGKNQSGDHAAVPALNLLGKIQQKGVAVLLACHTNAELKTAGSIQIERRANGIARVTKEPLWKEEIIRNFPKIWADKEKEFEQKISEQKQKIHRKFTQGDTVVVHVAFEKFRSKTPIGFEWALECKKHELKITEESEKQHLAYLDEIANRKSSRDAEAATRQEADGIDQSEGTTGDNRPTVEFNQQALSELVKNEKLQTRGDLARHLGISESTLDQKMTDKDLKNQSIGLQNRRGRRSKGKEKIR